MDRMLIQGQTTAGFFLARELWSEEHHFFIGWIGEILSWNHSYQKKNEIMMFLPLMFDIVPSFNPYFF
jgi:hypothetical protein